MSLTATARLLAYSPDWPRVADPMKKLGVEAELLDFTRVSPPGEPAAEFAWASPGVFIDGHASEFLEAALRCDGLKWLQSGSSGLDHPAFAKLAAKGVRLTSSDAPAVAIAEYVFACVLDHFQCGPQRRAHRQKAEWQPLPFREVEGTRWAIVGYGAIGREVAKRARSFGAHVTGIRRRQEDDRFANRISDPGHLEDLLPAVDVVVLSLPLSAATESFAGEPFFSAMKPGSIFVNVGRGRLVDEDALLRALQRRRPDHAVLDVFREEPLPRSSPFWSHPRVNMSPHLAGMGSGLTGRSDRLFLDNARRFLAGQPLIREVAP